MKSIFDELFNDFWFGPFPFFRVNEPKKIENKESKKGEETNYYLKVIDDLKLAKLFNSPYFTEKDGVYTHTENISKHVKPSDVDIKIYDDLINIAIFEKYENGGGFSSSNSSTIPEDLDRATLKAVIKNGVLTITANKIEKKEEKEPEFEQEEDVEYEVEINL